MDENNFNEVNTNPYGDMDNTSSNSDMNLGAETPTVNPDMNQQYGDPQNNPGYTDPNYNQQYGDPQNNPGYTDPNYNQQYGDPQYNQGYTDPNYNQQYGNPQYNQGYVDPNYNQQYGGPQYNQGYADPNYNQQYGYGDYNQGYGDNYYNSSNNTTSVKAVWSLVCGIAGILLCVCMGVFSAILGIIGIVLAVLSKNDTNGQFSGLAIGGLVTSILALVMGGPFALLIMYLSISDPSFWSL